MTSGSDIKIENARDGGGSFFRRIDWAAAGLCFLIAFGVYFFTLAPTVTLEDSGELAVASDYLGVPHPPGYPIWTLVTWFFQLIFHWVEYNGHPNPAWGVALSSGFFGALACAILSLLISRSGSSMLRSIERITDTLGEGLENLLCLVAGLGGGLLFAFSPVLWSQSTIVEVYSLNAFFLMLVILFLYMWMCRPREFKWMYAMAFSFGLGLTNHQSLVFMGLPLVVAVFLNEVRDWRDLLLPLAVLLLFMLGLFTSVPWIFIALAAGVAVFINRMPLLRDFALAGLVMFAMFYTSGWAGQNAFEHLNWSEGPTHPGFWIWTSLAIVFPALVALPREWRRGVSAALLILLSGFLLGRLWTIEIEGDPVALLQLPLPDPRLCGFAILIAALALLPAFFGRRVRLGLLIGAFVLALILSQRWVAAAGYNDLLISAGARQPGLWLALICSTVFWLTNCFDLPNGRAVGTTFLLLELGVSFYLLMPFASEQNPPINWAYPRTWKGFMHAVTRGQYEKINPILNLHKIGADPIYFLRQNYAIIFDPKGYISVVAQFTIFISLLALAPFFFLARISRRLRDWLIVSLVGFVAMTTIFIIFQYPKLDIQTLFIGRVQYIQAHAIFALWIGYGAMFVIAILDTLSKRRREVVFAGLLIVLLLPLAPVLRNAYDQELIQKTGSADQQGHDFGWQFGYYQLTGAQGILEELTPEERSDYPNPAYPPAMGTNAVFFGGTDPGRFVPTYMIYSADVRPDVYLITQNALADATYMNVMRDLYGNDIWIPGAQDSNIAFEQYVNDIRSGKVKAGADVNIKNGRVSVQGVGGVMKINAKLARMIFDNNRYIQSPEIMERFERGEDLSRLGVRVVDVDGEKRPVREFYVEESYVIQWMYPYLEPHGLIMKINPKPIELTDEMVGNDQDFWAWYSEHLLDDKAFKRDVVARKSFSKLRSSIAGLYVHRKRYQDAVTAFKQAIALYPLSPDANFRLSDTYMRMDEWNAAVATMEKFIANDPGNDKAAKFLKSIEQRRNLSALRKQIEAKMRMSGKLNLKDTLQLANIYVAMGMKEQFARLAERILADESMPSKACQEVARLASQARNIGLVEKALREHLRRQPKDYSAWINLAALELHKRDLRATLADLKRAIELGGDRARTTIRQDKRFRPLAKSKPFQQMLLPGKRGRSKSPRPLPRQLQNLIK